MNYTTALARKLRDYKHCSEGYKDIPQGHIEELLEACLPSGSGFDTNIEFDIEASTTNQLIFIGEYHVMDDNGTYQGYAHFIATIDGDLTGFDVNVVITNPEDFEVDPDDYPDEDPDDLWGLDVGGLEEYIADEFYDNLSQEVKK